MQDNQSILVGGWVKGQTGVGKDDRGVGGAARKKIKQMRIAGDADHHRIDLKESPALSALAEAGETSGAEANRRHAIKAAEGVARRRHCFTNRTGNVVVRQWHRPPAEQRAVLLTPSLRAMHRGAVIQPAAPAV